MKKIYYWVEAIILIIGVTYTIKLFLFKRSIKEISEKQYDSFIVRAFNIVQVHDYLSYLLGGIAVLAIFIGYTIYYIIKFSDGFFEEWQNYAILVLNIIFTIITAVIFYDPIFTSAIVVFLISGVGMWAISEY